MPAGQNIESQSISPWSPLQDKKTSHYTTSPNPYLPTTHTERGGGGELCVCVAGESFPHHFHSHSSKRSTLRGSLSAPGTVLKSRSRGARTVFWLQLPSADCTSRRIQESGGRLNLPANYRLRNMELGYPLMATVRMTCFLRALVLMAQG